LSAVPAELGYGKGRMRWKWFAGIGCSGFRQKAVVLKKEKNLE
jgi:hypothetical protein